MRPLSECKLGKGFALPLAPNPVREPAGSPTPFGWAYPVLAGAVFASGSWASADWGEFHSPLAPFGVREPAGSPTPFGRAYPVLVGAVLLSGRKPSAIRRVSAANLEVERFVEKAKWLFRKISRPEHRSSLKSWFGAETGESFTLPLLPLESGSLRASRHLFGGGLTRS